MQNEIVALIIKLTLAEQDPDRPPVFAGMLSALGAHAQAILDSVRQIARGIYPPALADRGVAEALRAQAVRASVHVSFAGIAPRSTQPPETAVGFSCFEASPNVARYAGRTAHARLGMHHGHGVLTVPLEDDGRGFDPEHTPDGAGLRNIQALGGTVKLTSVPGLGIVVTTSPPWPRTAEAGMTRPCPQATAIPVPDPPPHHGNLTTRRDDRRQ